MKATAAEAREILQPVIDRANRVRDEYMFWARLTRDSGGSLYTVRDRISRARTVNAEARAMLRELRRLEATA